MENPEISKIKTNDLMLLPKYKLNSPNNICTNLNLTPNSPKKPTSPKRLKPKKIDDKSPILKHIEKTIITKFKLEDDIYFTDEEDYYDDF
jgi:hypothetical protein